MKQNITKIILALFIFFNPLFALAQSQSNTTTNSRYLEQLIEKLGNIINLALNVLIPLTVLIVMIAGYQYIMSGGGDGAQKAKTTLTWAIVGMIVVIMSKALVVFVLQRLGINTGVFNL